MTDKHTKKEIIEHLKHTKAVLLLLILLVLSPIIAIFAFGLDDGTILATGSSILALIVLIYWIAINNTFIRELKDN